MASSEQLKPEQLKVDTLYPRLEEDLTRPRRVNDQVEVNINSQYSYIGEKFGEFLEEKYPHLQEYEVDLVFSPLFTPTAHDQRHYMPFLEDGHLSAGELDSLINRLEAAALSARFENVAGEVFQAPLHPVNMERYVRRLLLDKPIDPKVYQSICKTVSLEDARHEAIRIGRDPVWRDATRQEILQAFLHTFRARNSFSCEKLNYLTDFMRTYRPTSFEDIGRQLDSVIKSCQDDISDFGNRIVIDQQLQEAYSEEELSHLQHDRANGHYQQLMRWAEALKEDFDYLTSSR